MDKKRQKHGRKEVLLKHSDVPFAEEILTCARLLLAKARLFHGFLRQIFAVLTGIMKQSNILRMVALYLSGLVIESASVCFCSLFIHVMIAIVH